MATVAARSIVGKLRRDRTKTHQAFTPNSHARAIKGKAAQLLGDSWYALEGMLAGDAPQSRCTPCRGVLTGHSWLAPVQSALLTSGINAASSGESVEEKPTKTSVCIVSNGRKINHLGVVLVGCRRIWLRK